VGLDVEAGYGLFLSESSVSPEWSTVEHGICGDTIACDELTGSGATLGAAEVRVPVCAEASPWFFSSSFFRDLCGEDFIVIKASEANAAEDGPGIGGL